MLLLCCAVGTATFNVSIFGYSAVWVKPEPSLLIKKIDHFSYPPTYLGTYLYLQYLASFIII